MAGADYIIILVCFATLIAGIFIAMNKRRWGREVTYFAIAVLAVVPWIVAYGFHLLGSIAAEEGARQAVDAAQRQALLEQNQALLAKLYHYPKFSTVLFAVGVATVFLLDRRKSR